MKNYCEHLVNHVDMTDYFRCKEDRVEVQKQCSFYAQPEAHEVWCHYNYNRSGITDLCHNFKAQKEALKQEQKP